MLAEELLARLDATLRGEASLDQLGVWLEQCLRERPGGAAALTDCLERAHAEGRVRYDLYLLVRDRLAELAARPLATSVPADATQLRGATPATAEPRTRLRSAPSSTAAPSEPSVGSWRAAAPAQAIGPGERMEEPADWTLTLTQVLEPGVTIKGRFVLEERVGSGGMGMVFRARDRRKEEAQDRNPFVAIKFLNDDFRHHPEALKALQRESRRAQTLAHPNIVTVYDFDRDGTLIYMTMEYLEGQPLDDFIAQHPQGLEFKLAWPIVEGAGKALAYAHERGIVHADFKPGNVFVSSDRRVKVLDFGIARAVQKHGESPAEGTRFDAGVLGALTPAYASPEMLLHQDPDPRDDVFALACVAYELLTGRHPFAGVTALKAAHQGLRVKPVPGLDRSRQRALEHALAFRQEERTASVEAFLEEFGGVAAGRTRSARQTAAWAAVAVIVTAALAASAWWLTRPDPDVLLADYVLAEAAASAAPEDERDTDLRDILLEQGEEYLSIAAADFNPAILSEGVSSAYGAFRNALRMDPENPQAVDGILRIVRMYETQIEAAIAAGDSQRAADLIGYARKIAPNRASLQAFEQRVGKTASPE
ncbi:MAG TPA: serine/threonine-protein kinase [Steroidobacteraceae bacterium]|nr:serine/threonine-protein kinase [Steroidobacteraceae bacterium]